MYETYFGLRRRPFAPAPAPEQYFAGEAIESARQTITRCIERAEGAAMVIGPTGTGKTLLCHVLAEQLRGGLAVVLLASGRLSSRGALYQAILYGLKRGYRGMDEGELRLALVDYLTTCESRPDGMVLLVDEAHTLPLRLLDEIRMLTNLVCAGQSRVRVVLVGGPVLEDRFASPKLESFSQRLRARCYLASLRGEETQRYIRGQIDAAGGSGRSLFTDEALQAVHHATDGVPRLINQVCDHALLLASSAGVSRIDARQIEEAWADLQQLPTPYSVEDLTSRDSANAIEFGGLEDEPPEDARAVAAASGSRSTGLPLDATGEEPSEQVERIERTLAELDEVERACEAADDEFRPAGSIRPEVELVFEDFGNPFQEPFAHEELIVQRYRSTDAVRRSAEAGGQWPTGEAEDPPAWTSIVPEEESPTAGARKGEATDEPRTVPLRRPDFPVPSISQTIVLGDEPSGEEQAGPRIIVARRPEYRRLFAKLRRG